MLKVYPIVLTFGGSMRHLGLVVLLSFCVCAPAASAQSSAAPSKTTTASTRQAWEYGQLIYVGMQDQKALGPIWLGADTTMHKMLDSVSNLPATQGRFALPTSIRLL